jgi:arsenate reductase-like glutaredoxin family protein
MKVYLMKEDCWDVIEKDAPEAAEQLVQWNKRDSKAYCYITLCIENSQITHIKNCKTAKEAWTSLKKHHQKPTMSSKIRLQRKLYRAELKKGDNDIEAHLNMLFEIMDELADLGHELKDKDKIGIILASLNDEYDAILDSFGGRDEDSWTIEDVKSLLLDKAERKKTENSFNSSMSALKVTTKNRTSE